MHAGRALGIKGSDSSSVPHQRTTWSEDDVKRLLAPRLTICQQIKPKETPKLYGMKQRLCVGMGGREQLQRRSNASSCAIATWPMASTLSASG